MYVAVEIKLMGVPLRVTGYYDREEKTFDWDAVYGIGDHGTVDLTDWVDSCFVKEGDWDSGRVHFAFADLPTIITEKCLAWLQEREASSKEDKV